MLSALLCLLSWPAFATPVDLVYGPGTYTFSSPITYSGNDQFSLRCAGRDRTTLIWTGTGTFIDVTYTEMSKPPRIEGCTILTRGYDTDTAIALDGPTTAGAMYDSPVIRDITIRGEDPITDVWSKAIVLNNVWYLVIDGAWISGLGNAGVLGSPPFPMDSCIEFSRTQVLEAHDFHCFYAQDGVIQTDAELGEGQLFHDFEIVGVNRGFVLRSMGGTAIRDGHVNCWFRCFDLDGKYQISIHDVLIFKWFQSTLNWEGVKAQNGSSLQLHNLTIHGNPSSSGTSMGIYLVNVKHSVIADNIGGWFTGSGNVLVLIGTGATKNQITDNLMMDNCGAGGSAGYCGPVVFNPGGVTGNFIDWNKP